MSEPRFTPGPWVARYDDRVSVPDDTDGTKSIAHIYGRKGAPYAQSANQALIAAAPDLYAAAKLALAEMVRTSAPRNSFTDAVDALDAALAKVIQKDRAT